MVRPIFSDGFNSISHFYFGVFAYYTDPSLVSSLFLLYQLSERNQANTWIDVSEFIIGIIIAHFLHSTIVFIRKYMTQPRENFENNIQSKKSQNGIALATMVTNQPDFDKWLLHHIPLVDKIYLRIENAPSIVQLSAQYPNKIEYEVIDDGNKIKKNNYFTQMDRQKDFVNRMIEKAKTDGIEYLFHIDADELIDSNGGLLDNLRLAPLGTVCIHLKNYEAVFNNNQSCFDAAKFLDCEKETCKSYANGKSVAVISQNPKFNGPHYFHGKLFDMPPDKIRILHFDSCKFDAWKEKFMRMKDSKKNDIPFQFYQQSIELINKDPVPTDSELLSFYRLNKWTN